jgi:hypothetical protein
MGFCHGGVVAGTPPPVGCVMLRIDLVFTHELHSCHNRVTGLVLLEVFEELNYLRFA